MSRRKPRTKFGLDDKVRIVGPTVPDLNTGTTRTFPEGTVGIIADMWEAFGEYIVAIPAGHGYGQWVFGEASLTADVEATDASIRSGVPR